MAPSRFTRPLRAFLVSGAENGKAKIGYMADPGLNMKERFRPTASGGGVEMYRGYLGGTVGLQCEDVGG